MDSKVKHILTKFSYQQRTIQPVPQLSISALRKGNAHDTTDCCLKEAQHADYQEMLLQATE